MIRDRNTNCWGALCRLISLANSLASSFDTMISRGLGPRDILLIPSLFLYLAHIIPSIDFCQAVLVLFLEPFVRG